MEDLPSTVLQDYCPIHRGACCHHLLHRHSIHYLSDRRTFLEEKMTEQYPIQYVYIITCLHLQMDKAG